MLTKRIVEAVNKARELFEIKDFPGDFFSVLEELECDKKFGIVLFKEDIDKLSGFIGYGENDIAVVCLNYKRPHGHQNFTLAHEIGHWIMHHGQNISDGNILSCSRTDIIENEANAFARELLYPETCLVQDYHICIENDLFLENNRKLLAVFVDELCTKYCLSFDVVLRNLLFKNRQVKQYNRVRKEIEIALGGKVSEVFDKDFYVPNEEMQIYQRYMKPYLKLKDSVDQLVKEGKTGEATAESIKLRNGVL